MIDTDLSKRRQTFKDAQEVLPKLDFLPGSSYDASQCFKRLAMKVAIPNNARRMSDIARVYNGYGTAIRGSQAAHVSDTPFSIVQQFLVQAEEEGILKRHVFSRDLIWKKSSVGVLMQKFDAF